MWCVAPFITKGYKKLFSEKLKVTAAENKLGLKKNESHKDKSSIHFLSTGWTECFISFYFCGRNMV